MLIYVTCACGQEFETSEANAGKSTLCPICGRVLTLPREVASLAPPIPQPDVVHITDEPVPARTSRAAIASLVLGALLFFACLSGVPAILLGWRALRDIRWSGGRLSGKWMAEIGIWLGVIGCVLTLALPEFLEGGSREVARRTQCVTNLKQIGLAMHNYHAAFDCFPPAASTDKNGKPLLSWRVAILPYIEENFLYSQFHLDEPWDSPHNLALLRRTPSPFVCPSDTTTQPGMTTYQVVVGPSTAFRPDFQPLTINDFLDRTTHTILAVESRHPVPWTKPDDVPHDLIIPYTGLGRNESVHHNGFNALMVDGSVKFIKNSTDPREFRAALTRNGNERPSKNSF